MDQHVYLFTSSMVALVLSLLFGVINGFRNAPLVVATVISTRAISPSRAFFLCALAEAAGILLFGSAVVANLSHGMFKDMVRGEVGEIQLVLISAILSAIGWGLFCHWKALPTSNNHALFAGISGASAAAWGFDHLINGTLITIFVVLILSPMAGLLLSAGVTWSIRWLGEWMTPKVVGLADKLHITAALLVSAVDGSNGGQIVLSMSILSVGFFTFGAAPSTETTMIPFWLKCMVGGATALGVLMEGRRIVKRLGMSFYHLEIPQGVGAQLSGASLILTFLTAGFPTSTAHIMTGSILGAGLAKSPRAVRWSAAGDVVFSWVLTIPMALIVSFCLFKVFHLMVRA